MRYRDIKTFYLILLLKKELGKGMGKRKKEGIKEGMEKGMEKGKKEGIKEGMEKGMEKGKKEGIKEGNKRRGWKKEKLK